jgi:glycine cleavage system aminomethyltransferase T
MPPQNLEEAVQTADSIVEMLRGLEVGSFDFPVVEDEYTHWIEEQRAWRETVALADQSYHMTGYHVEGPDARQLFNKLSIIDLSESEPGEAKQFIACNPHGDTIGDGILFHLDNEEFVLIGAPIAPDWVQYHFETGDYDASATRQGSAIELPEGEDPAYFRYEVQGPNALDLIDEVIEGPLPETPFFHFDDITIDGYTVNALRHSMSGEAGFEIWGPHEYGKDIKETIMDVGQDYGIRHLGTRSYRSSAPMSGWIEFQLPAVYDSEEMKEYREWLTMEHLASICSIGGSYRSDDITDYYLNPIDLGHEDIIDFDHEFIGREALEEEVKNPQRTKVSLFWDGDDVVDVYASLFKDSGIFKFMDLLDPSWDVAHYDAVLKDGDPIGVSKWPTYTYNERSVVSLACIDRKYSEPGTEVTVIWGEEDSLKPHVERHIETELTATVGAVPPGGDRR